ncbi:MAG: conjugal transfer protein TrbD [Sedimenticola sp.]|uniref:Conjugal transfer protein TrbD n=2 Tax=Sedimenticola TaxID=349742 RepID=A0A558CLL5_9GAMM|nr:conjugal transfer protein TrbD [Sedimenticola selenatireducens]PLY12869.1 MAG: conjugal transfer protein TrbD [Sedimenticola sp.]TVO69689.1 conjugal transfer protein TrbD [Sedimenticola selenatireducens]TVT49680.1 MAG: conjugal transfer protein TrbD [Sedimenticola thiotaurini]TVT62243.1 MAG: conjugal transfer protein TrbD [Sedimenticola selenatireducens]
MKQEQDLITVPIRRSLTRPRLIAGAERELFLFLGLICACFIFIFMNWPSAFIGILFWIGGIYALREMAKADPMMSKIYIRHRQYQAYYPARSPRTVKESQKRKTKPCWR